MRITASHVIRLAPVMVLAGFASGLVIQWVSPQTVTTWLGDDVLGILIAATLGIAINVPLLFEIPLVAVLLLAGMGKAPAAALLFTAAAGGPITFWGLAKVMPRKAIATFGVSTWGLGAAGGLVVLVFVSLGAGPDFGLRADYSTATHLEAGKSVPSPAAGAPVEPEAQATIFTDVARTAHVDFAHYRRSSDFLAFGAGVVVLDYDGDGNQDIYVPMAYDDRSTCSPSRCGPRSNALYRNEGDGTFTQSADEAPRIRPTGNRERRLRRRFR